MKKIAIATLLAAIIAAFVISVFYNKSLKISTVFLDTEEKNLTDMIGPSELYYFYADPKESPDTAISWEKDPAGLGQKLLKINFNGDSIRHYKGLNLSMSLSLARLRGTGSIEIWARANNRTNAVSELAVFLKDARGYQQQVVSSVPFKFDNKWQRLILPLKEFKIAASDKGNINSFSWEIDRIAFSLAPFISDKPAVLWIRNLRIINDGKTISTLF